jgi:hypothetical protein
MLKRARCTLYLIQETDTLGPNGFLRFRPEVFDFRTDSPVHGGLEQAPTPESQRQSRRSQ